MRPDEVVAGDVRRPRALRPGDRVVVVAPSGPLRDDGPENLERGLEVLRGWGLEPAVAPHARERDGYLAGSDLDRASDLTAAFRDGDVRAVFTTRGGYGATRMVDLLDWEAFRRDPIWLVGFSDITALHAAAWQRTSTVTIHGQFATRLHLQPEGRLEQLRRMLFGEVGEGSVLELAGTTAEGDTAVGRLLGGNLALLTHLIGTVDELDPRGALLVLEDVGELPYRVDRMLIQLLRSTLLDEIEGLVLGRFIGCDPPATAPDRTVEHVLDDLVGSLAIPAVADAPLGHTDDQIPLPLGVECVLDADARTLTLLEALTA